jgi:hypothetical protein
MKNTIAVIIPFRGELEYLEQAVNSVRSSTFIDFRILVFDDNEQPLKDLNFLNNDEYFPTGGIGLPAVIEYSKSLISEEYIAILAGDDLMTSSRLQLQIDAICSKRADICLSRMQKFSAKHSDMEMLTGNPKIETFTKIWLLLGAYGADGTILMKSDFYRNKYVLDPTDSYSDWELALTNYPAKIAYVPENLVCYRQHKGQTTRKSRNDFFRSGVYPAWQRTFNDLYGSAPSLDVFLILGAPWFRSNIQTKTILESRFYAAQILKSFRSQTFTTIDQHSAESLLIRRYLFRVSFKRLIPVLYVIYSLDIKHPIRRIIRESIKILRALLIQRDVKPRFVKA